MCGSKESGLGKAAFRGPFFSEQKKSPERELRESRSSSFEIPNTRKVSGEGDDMVTALELKYLRVTHQNYHVKERQGISRPFEALRNVPSNECNGSSGERT